jgi:hypothetical protein
VHRSPSQRLVAAQHATLAHDKSAGAHVDLSRRSAATCVARRVVGVLLLLQLTLEQREITSQRVQQACSDGQNGQIDGVARGADNQAQPSAAQIVSAITDVAKTQKIDMAVARHTETLKTVGIVDFSVNDTFASALEKINVLSAVLKHEHEPEVARIVLERALNTTVFMKLSRRMERANGSWTASGVFEAGDWRTILVEQNVLDHTVPWCKDTPKIDFSKSYATYHVGVRQYLRDLGQYAIVGAVVEEIVKSISQNDMHNDWAKSILDVGNNAEVLDEWLQDNGRRMPKRNNIVNDNGSNNSNNVINNKSKREETESDDEEEDEDNDGEGEDESDDDEDNKSDDQDSDDSDNEEDTTRSDTAATSSSKVQPSVLPPARTATRTPTSLECVVCCDAAKNILFEPCNHLVACEACAKSITKCPICRSLLTAKKKVFMG